MEKDKKIVAALSAVLQIVTEDSSESFITPITGNIPCPWAAYGRTQTMQYRDITQRRLIKRTR
ncbi:MAG: hypothetical protein U1C33_06985 [Candidatus Cloacimonadaceae bacterium]|nr:hypothetical protein [Candidatus Cloacimonadaceae bacterium]